MFVFLFYVFCVSVPFCVLILLLCTAVSFLRLYKFTDRCHRVENPFALKKDHIVSISAYKKLQIWVNDNGAIVFCTFKNNL